MYCTHCGTRLSEDAKFCSNCGRSVGADTNEHAAAEKLVRREAVISGKKLRAILLGAAGLVLTALLIVAVAGGDTGAGGGTDSDRHTETTNEMRQPELVTGEIRVDIDRQVPKYAVPELDAWSGGIARRDRMIAKTETFVNYDVSTEVVEEYVRMLQANGFTLVDEYYFSYRDTFRAWALTCDAVPDAETIKMQYEDTACHVSIWTADADNKRYRIDISPSLQFCDTGLRMDGTVAQLTISGPSAGAGLLRMPDGSYQTTDGRLSAFVGTAAVIRDGQSYTCDARWEAENGDERLWVENYYRNEGFLFEVPQNSLMEGDLLQIDDVMRERYYVTEKGRFAGYNWHTPLFAIAYDGIWKGPELHSTDFEAVTIRLMYYQSGGEAVYYVYAKLKNSQPGEVEALAVVDMSVGSGGSFGDAMRLAVGDIITLNYAGEEFGAHYHVYEWTITDGAGNVTIETSGKSCRVTALSKGIATITVTYRYGVDEPNVLTGNPTPTEKSKTQSYNIIIE